MEILTSDQMAHIDRRANLEFGIPSIVLMENAALGVVDVIERHWPDADGVALFCGTGNNGGDGLAVARHLANRGYAPRIFLLGSRDKVRDDAERNLRVCVTMEIPIDEVHDDEDLLEALARAADCDLIVDAIFGTGLSRPATGVHAEAIRGMCELERPILAIDLPSGLDGSTREVHEPAVEANVTVTFCRPKVAHIFDPASSYCGDVVVADISIPRAAVDQENVLLSILEPDDALGLVLPRAADTHKGTYGHAVLVSGSPGKSGAAILAARGAVRGGSGLVTVVTDRETADVVDSTSIESMTLRVEREIPSIRSILEFLEAKSAVLVGPGLPDDDESYEFVRALVAKITLPTVIDATGVNAFAGRIGEINPDSGPRVLTPHPGELARLMGTSTDEITADRTASATTAAEKSRSVVVLKGHQTLVAAPDGRIAVNPTGNPGMASGGSGDVLAGLLVALLAQGNAPFDAACAAVYLHGLAGDIVHERRSDIGLAAMDLAEAIPDAIERLRTGR